MKLDELSKEELIEIVKGLKRRKKYGLVWEDKPEDVVEQCKKELPVLEEVKDKAIEKDTVLPTNLFIEGDNYHALSVLNYTHAGKIDVIYIDPPYNTGARDWKYNNHYVDEADTFRHSKWVSFMYHRLLLCKDLLAENGIICVTIDDNELPRLWFLLEEIFGESNHLGTIAIRINPGGRKSKRKVALQHEYALFFAKNAQTKVAPFFVDPADKSHTYYQDSDGNWYEQRNLRKEGQDSLALKKDGTLSHRYYPIYFDPETGAISVENELKETLLPIDTKGQKRIWRRGKEDIENMYKNGDLTVRKTKYGYQLYFRFKGGLQGETPKSFWEDKKYSASEHGTGTLDKVMKNSGTFQFPKSPYAVIDCIRVCSAKKNAIVLDFFAGSGTTGHAVMMLNKQDEGNRSFILCTNNENGIAEEVCYPRIKNVIDGYADVPGVPANVRYFKTSFVSASKVSDDTRRVLVRKSTEMICIRENTFNKIHDKEAYKVYKDGNHVTGILFDLEAITDFKNTLRELELPAHIYVFSLSNDTYTSDFADLELEHELCPIPESILEVYRKLFK